MEWASFHAWIYYGRSCLSNVFPLSVALSLSVSSLNKLPEFSYNLWIRKSGNCVDLVELELILRKRRGGGGESPISRRGFQRGDNTVKFDLEGNGFRWSGPVKGQWKPLWRWTFISMIMCAPCDILNPWGIRGMQTTPAIYFHPLGWPLLGKQKEMRVVIQLYVSKGKAIFVEEKKDRIFDICFVNFRLS